jgi:hypothetical protein
MGTPDDHSRFADQLARAVFYVGVVAGLALAAAAAWGDFEGLSYFATGAGYRPFDGLRCPVFMASTETGIVTGRFDNPGNQTIEPYYEVEISGRAASRQLEGQIAVPAHGRRELAWATDVRDTDLDQFVFVKLDVLPVAGFPTREATCGILITDVAGMSGGWIMSFAVVVSSLFMVVGLILPASGLSQDQAMRYDLAATSNTRRSTQVLGLATELAILPALGGLWLLAVVLIVISLLLLLISARYSQA